MSNLGSLYIRLGEPEGESLGCCELSDWAADYIEQQAKQIEALKAELEQTRIEYGRATSLSYALNN